MNGIKWGRARLSTTSPERVPCHACLQLDLWRDGRGEEAHPMAAYTLRARDPFTEDRGKCMVDPDHMAGFNVRAAAAAPPP